MNFGKCSWDHYRYHTQINYILICNHNHQFYQKASIIRSHVEPSLKKPTATKRYCLVVVPWSVLKEALLASDSWFGIICGNLYWEMQSSSSLMWPFFAFLPHLNDNKANKSKIRVCLCFFAFFSNWNEFLLLLLLFFIMLTVIFL